MPPANSHPDSPSDHSSSPPKVGGALRIVGASAAPLSPTQKRFNKLLARVEGLRAAQRLAEAEWDRALANYIERIHPLETQARSLRLEMIHMLAAVWRAPKGLGKRQRPQLRDLLLAQIDLCESTPLSEQEADLITLREELMDDLRAEHTSTGKSRSKDPLAPDFDPLAEFEEDDEEGDDEFEGMDRSKFRPDMTPEEVFAEITRQMFGQGEPEAEPHANAAQAKARKPSAAQLKKERREADLEEARKRSISTVYKQLAKVLHPDLERDPERRLEKERLMQELTVAYKNGDLHTLLRLELEFIHCEQGDLNHLGEEKLKIYCELLGEQITTLEAAARNVPTDPRYAALRPYVNPYFLRLPSWPDIEGDLRGQIMAIRKRTEELAGPRARQEMRFALQVFVAKRKREIRAGFGTPFSGFY